MKIENLDKLADTIKALKRSLTYATQGSISLETFSDKLHIKMIRNEAFLVLSGLVDYDAKIIDEYKNTVTIQINVKG